MGRALFSVCAALVAGCYDAHLRPTDAGPVPDAPHVSDAPTGGGLVWALVHPSDAPMGPGLFLLDEARGTILRHLPLPPESASPHGLAWDGLSLWLSDVNDVTRPMVFELSPDDGSVRSSFVGPATEGLGFDPATGMLWGSTVSGVTRLVRFDRAGLVHEAIETGEATIQEVAFVDGSLYYLVNDELDRIVRVELEGHESTELARAVDPAPYSLGFDGTDLAAAMWGHVRRYDPRTGALTSDHAFPVPGWITAIAFVR